MRHGRKSKNRTFNGFKSHLGSDLDTNLILACGITPANRPEAEALPGIEQDLSRYRERNKIGELHIDRGYIASDTVPALYDSGVPIVSKPWAVRGRTLFSKADFILDLGHMKVICPAGHIAKVVLGKPTRFPAPTCSACELRPSCTTAANDRGRSINISADERVQQKLRLAIAKPSGREQLRERTAVEHRLAHHRRKQGTHARYLGTRKNLFDARRHAATINLETIHFANAA